MDLFQKDSNCDGSFTPDPVTGLIDSTGFLLGGSSGQPSNLAADIAGSKELLDSDCHSSHQTLKLRNSDVDDLVAFLKTLTDDRVRWEQAPFDHLSLTLPNGHVGDENKVKFNAATHQAKQETIELPAVGAAGRQAKGLPALQSFDAGLQ